MYSTSPDRIEASIARVQVQIDAADAAGVAKLNASLAALDPLEFCAYQNEQARAHAAGVLSTDEALTVHNILNEWDAASLAARITVTKLIEELMRPRVAGRV